MEQLTGVVKCWLENRNYGYIQAEDGHDFFIHYSDIVNMRGFRVLMQGERVRFYPEIQADGRLRALELEVIPTWPGKEA